MATELEYDLISRRRSEIAREASAFRLADRLRTDGKPRPGLRRRLWSRFARTLRLATTQSADALHTE